LYLQRQREKQIRSDFDDDELGGGGRQLGCVLWTSNLHTCWIWMDGWMKKNSSCEKESMKLDEKGAPDIYHPNPSSKR